MKEYIKKRFSLKNICQGRKKLNIILNIVYLFI